MYRRLCAVLLLVQVCVAQGEEQAKPPKSETVETFSMVPGLEDGTGAEHRDLLLTAKKAMKEGDLPTAVKQLEKVVANFKALCTDPKKTYLSFANKAEFDSFKKDHPDQDVVWLDWAYQEAWQISAFIASGTKHFKEALECLTEEEKIAPCRASPHNERGYILNQAGKPKEAMAEYQKSRALGEKFKSSSVDLPVALRGIGFSLIELGDLDAAKKVFEESLKIDPDNETAKNELQFIEEAKAQKK